MAYGQVIGGDFHGSSVTTATFGSDLVVQAGFKGRRLSPDNVAEWTEVPGDDRPSTVSAVGRAVAGAVAPRFLSKSASAAVGAAIDSKSQKPHIVRVDWVDGKQSLLKLPEDQFTHFAVVLRERRAPEAAGAPGGPAPMTVAVAPEPPHISQQAISLVSDIVRSRLPAAESAPQPPAMELQITDQLTKLAALRDQGILTEEEFSSKKAELLGRL